MRPSRDNRWIRCPLLRVLLGKCRIHGHSQWEAEVKSISILLVTAAMLAAAGCAGGAGVGVVDQAPEPRKPIDVARFYSGMWHEIARRPMAITNGCVAGATEYGRSGKGSIQVLDSCRMGSPQGEVKTVGEPVAFLIRASTPSCVWTTNFMALCPCSATTGFWIGLTIIAGSSRPTRRCAISISSRATHRSVPPSAGA